MADGGRVPNLDRGDSSRVGEELVDILQYLVRIADILDIELAGAFEEKIRQNAARYPIDEVWGSAEKR